jgi:hypothetical protein
MHLSAVSNRASVLEILLHHCSLDKNFMHLSAVSNRASVEHVMFMGYLLFM